MNVKNMSVQEIASIKITSVEQGKLLAEEIRLVQIDIHRQMVGLYDKQKWQALCDSHYELRKVRQKVLHSIGEIIIVQKNLKKR